MPAAEVGGLLGQVDGQVDLADLLERLRGVLQPCGDLSVLGMASDDRVDVVVKDGRAEKRQVRTSERRVGDVQILSGLVAGEQVVTEGTQKLRDGAPVTVEEPAPARASNSAEGQRS